MTQTFSRMLRVARSFLLSSAFVVLLSSPAVSVFAAPAPSANTASVANGDVLTGNGGFQWYPSVTANGGTQYNVAFNTIGDTPVVRSVDVHYIIDSSPLKNFGMKNATDPTIFTLPAGFTLISTDAVFKFNFTYFSLLTNTGGNTAAFSYTPSENKIKLIQNIVTPIAGPAIWSSNYGDENTGKWKVGVQTYTNLPNQVAIMFQALNKNAINEKVDVHYTIGNGNALSNFRMTQNTTAQPDNTAIYYQDVQLLQGELLKWNQTYYSVVLGAAVDTVQAFVWTQGSSIQEIGNVVDQVDQGSLPSDGTSNSNGASGSTTGSTSGTSGASTPGSTSGTSGASTPSSSNPPLAVRPNKNGAAGVQSAGIGAMGVMAFGAVIAMML